MDCQASERFAKKRARMGILQKLRKVHRQVKAVIFAKCSASRLDKPEGFALKEFEFKKHVQVACPELVPSYRLGYIFNIKLGG